jgi:hypothetical protein
MIHGALASAADPAAMSASGQQYQAKQQQQGGEEADGEGSEDDAGDGSDADGGHRSSSSSRGAGGGAEQPPIGRFKSLPSKLGGAAARAAAAGRGLKHTGSLPSNRPAPSSSCMSPGALFRAQSLHGSLNWSPSRLLLSPQHGGRGRGAAAGVDVGRDVNDEEAAGECTCSLGSVTGCCAVRDSRPAAAGNHSFAVPACLIAQATSASMSNTTLCLFLILPHRC